MEENLVPRKKLRNPNIDSKELADTLSSILDEHKGEQIELISLAGKSDIADYMIITTGRSDRHIQSLADYVGMHLKKSDVPYSIEGMESKNWVLVDTAGVIVHIFTNDARALYKLEDLWKI